MHFTTRIVLQCHPSFVSGHHSTIPSVKWISPIPHHTRILDQVFQNLALTRLPKMHPLELLPFYSQHVLASNKTPAWPDPPKPTVQIPRIPPRLFQRRTVIEDQTWKCFPRHCTPDWLLATMATGPPSWTHITPTHLETVVGRPNITYHSSWYLSKLLVVAGGGVVICGHGYGHLQLINQRQFHH